MQNITFILPALFLVGGHIRIERAQAAETWTWRNPAPTGATLESVTHGSGRYIAVGEGGAVVASPDGAIWTREPSGTQARLRGVAYGDGTFVAVGDSGIVVRATSGNNWNAQVVVPEINFRAVAHGGGRFVALGAARTSSGVASFWTSTDGLVWNANSTPVPARLHGLLSVGGGFLAFGDHGEVWRSADGASWTRGSAAGVNSLLAGAVDGGSVMLIGAGGEAWVTPALPESSWTARNTGYGEWFYGLARHSAAYAAVGAGGRIITSVDGVAWTRRSTGRAETLRAVAAGSAGFVAVGERGMIMNSVDGVTWVRRRSGHPEWLMDVAYGDGAFVAVGASEELPNFASRGVILTSTNGTDWARALAPSTEVFAVTHGNRMFVAVGAVWNGSGYQGVALTSTNGKTWAQRNVGVSLALFSVTFGNGLFVAMPDTMGVTTNTSVVTSADGITWTRRSIGALREFAGITFGDGRFVAVGEAGAVATSSDGVTWSVGDTGTRTYLWDVAWGAGRFVAAGNGGVITTSADGLAWKSAASETDQALLDVDFGEDHFVAVGGRGTVLFSPDGVSWQTSHSGTQQRLLGVTFGQEGFVAVGDHGAILQCDVSKLQAADITPLSERDGLTPTEGGPEPQTTGQHAMADVRFTPGGGVELGFKGAPPTGFGSYYDLYPVDASEDLRQWSYLGTLLRTNAVSTNPKLLDAVEPGRPARFYRTRPEASPVPSLPPTGPFPVGRVIREIAHTSHPFRNRFMVSIWYPAAPTTGRLPARYFETKSAVDIATAYGGSATVFEGMRTHAVAEESMSGAKAAYPVVLASPAANNPRSDATDKAEDLASHGFVVVAADAWDTPSTLHPDQEIVVGGDHWAPFQGQREGRVADLRRVLEALQRMNGFDERFAGRLDLKRVGVFGYSFGGATAFGTWEQDSRCAAALLLDGVPTSTWVSGASDKALMAICGADGHPFVGPFRNRLLEIVNSMQTNAYWLRIGGSNHGDFGDYPWFQNRSRIRTSMLLRRYIVSFFKKHIQGVDDHFLDSAPAEYPEVQGFVSRGN